MIAAGGARVNSTESAVYTRLLPKNNKKMSLGKIFALTEQKTH